jgi:hypothetical protein
VSIAADTGQAISLLNAVSFIASALGNTFWQALVTGDTNPRAILDTTGAGVLRLRFGPGNAAPDINIARSAAGLLNITVPGVTSLLTSDLDIATIGKGLQIAEGSNARMGVATLAAGTVTVSNTSVTANTRIFLTSQTTGAAPGTPRVSARTAGTSFTITSTSGTDTSQVAWLLIEPG